jgi:hypothetical protein
MGTIEFDFSSGGRLGNSIIDLFNCFCYAVKNNYNVCIHNTHTRPNQIAFKTILINNENNENIISTQKCFYLTKTFLHSIQYDKVYDIIKSVRTLNGPYRENNDLVIHIRAGDCFGTEANNCFGGLFYMTPPLIYYKTILDNYNFDIIYIIAEDTANPLINKLLELYPNINFKLQDLNKDIELLLSVRNVVFSVGTFLNVLLFSDNVKRVFEPKYIWNVENFDVTLNDNEYIYSLYTMKNKKIHFEYIPVGNYPKTMLDITDVSEKFKLLQDYKEIF